MTTMRTRYSIALAAAVAVLALTACTATQLPIRGAASPGFLLGLWQGFIAPIAFIISIFSDSVRIYAFPNTGLWYDFGFMLGISGFSGGVFAGARNKRAK